MTQENAEQHANIEQRLDPVTSLIEKYWQALYRFTHAEDYISPARNYRTVGTGTTVNPEKYGGVNLVPEKFQIHPDVIPRPELSNVLLLQDLQVALLNAPYFAREIFPDPEIGEFFQRLSQLVPYIRQDDMLRISRTISPEVLISRMINAGFDIAIYRRAVINSLRRYSKMGERETEHPSIFGMRELDFSLEWTEPNSIDVYRRADTLIGMYSGVFDFCQKVIRDEVVLEDYELLEDIIVTARLVVSALEALPDNLYYDERRDAIYAFLNPIIEWYVSGDSSENRAVFRSPMATEFQQLQVADPNLIASNLLEGVLTNPNIVSKALFASLDISGNHDLRIAVYNFISSLPQRQFDRSILKKQMGLAQIIRSVRKSRIKTA